MTEYITGTRYSLCTTPCGWSDPQRFYFARRVDGGRRHRTIAAAASAEAALQRAVRRRHGAGAYSDARILAELPDVQHGRVRYRGLDDVELDELYVARGGRRS